VEGKDKLLEDEHGNVIEDEWDDLPELDDYEADEIDKLQYMDEQLSQFNFKGYSVDEI
jgi:hypothetical protein